MTNKAELLIDKMIERTEIIHDYIQLLFSDGSILNIFNAYSITDASESTLIGYEINAVKQEKEALSLFLSPRGVIRIGMEDLDYRGPEALEYIEQSSPRVIWP